MPSTPDDNQRMKKSSAQKTLVPEEHLAHEEEAPSTRRSNKIDGTQGIRVIQLARH
jgi:hypothetical protein